MEQFFNVIHINYLLVFVFLSYGLRNLFAIFVKSIIPQCTHPKRYGVFIIALIIGVIYNIALSVDFEILLMTYTVGTTFYELILDEAKTIIKNYTKRFTEE